MSGVTLSPDVLVSHLEGEAVLLHMGTKRYFRLNRTGAYIWKALEAGSDLDSIAPSLVESFEVSLPEAEAAVKALVGDLVEGKLIAER